MKTVDGNKKGAKWIRQQLDKGNTVKTGCTFNLFKVKAKESARVEVKK
jgi:hypothetical protein